MTDNSQIKELISLRDDIKRSRERVASLIEEMEASQEHNALRILKVVRKELGDCFIGLGLSVNQLGKEIG